MLYLIEEFDELLPGVWRAMIPRDQLLLLSDTSQAQESVSVLVGPVERQGNELRFNPREVTMVALGAEEGAILVNTDSKRPAQAGRFRESGKIQNQLVNDDGPFLAACDRLVGNELRTVGESILEGFRELYPGRMVEGKGRKWTNQPQNFVAITIQNRDRSFAVSIRDVVEAKGSRLQPRPDRPGYLRFKISSPSDVPEATRLILASAKR